MKALALTVVAVLLLVMPGQATWAELAVPLVAIAMLAIASVVHLGQHAPVRSVPRRLA